jgi:hypothetical protein
MCRDRSHSFRFLGIGFPAILSSTWLIPFDASARILPPQLVAEKELEEAAISARMLTSINPSSTRLDSRRVLRDRQWYLFIQTNYYECPVMQDLPICLRLAQMLRTDWLELAADSQNYRPQKGLKRG